MHMSIATGETTSAAALRSVNEDSAFLSKQVSLMLALYFQPMSTPDEVSALTDLSGYYVRPRLSYMNDYGILEISGRSNRTRSGRVANTLRIAQPWADMMAQAPEGELETLCTAIFVECRADWEAKQIESALASGLVE